MRSSLPFVVSGLTILAVAQSITSTAFPLAPTTLVTKTVDTATTNASPTTSPSSVGGFTTLFQLVSANTPVFSSSSAAPTVSVQHFEPSTQLSAGPDASDPHTMDGFSDGSSYHDVTENTPESHGINYYFIFIGVAIGLLILGLWALYRRKRAQKAIRRTHNRHRAATSDISSAWRGTAGSRRGGGQSRSNSSRRRWMQRGAPWHNRPVDTEAPLVEREEGLNELGEAPPAYVKEIYGNMAPRITVSSVRSLTPEDTNMARPVVTVEGPAIPMRCLSSNERERPRTASSMGDKPPDYEEATSAVNTPIPSSPPTLDSHLHQEARSPPS